MRLGASLVDLARDEAAHRGCRRRVTVREDPAVLRDRRVRRAGARAPTRTCPAGGPPATPAAAAAGSPRRIRLRAAGAPASASASESCPASSTTGVRGRRPSPCGRRANDVPATTWWSPSRQASWRPPDCPPEGHPGVGAVAPRRRPLRRPQVDPTRPRRHLAEQIVDRLVALNAIRPTRCPLATSSATIRPPSAGLPGAGRAWHHGWLRSRSRARGRNCSSNVQRLKPGAVRYAAGCAARARLRIPSRAG